MTPSSRALAIRQAAIREAVAQVQACGLRYREIENPSLRSTLIGAAADIAHEVEALLARDAPLCEDED